jgi:hypothetical protein
MKFTRVDAGAGELGQKESFLLRHDLSEHPLLTLDAVARLAEKLPERSVEHNLGSVPLLLPGGGAPRSDASHRDLVRSADLGDSWIALINIEQDPEYASLLDEALDAAHQSFGGSSTARGRVGFIFLSAPGAVTPAHVDPEENILIQIRGSKTLAVSSFPSARVRGEVAEQYHGGPHRNVDGLPTEPKEMAIDPGGGAYIPLYCPHWVTVGTEVSVSLSVTWRPKEVDRTVSVVRFNKWLRRYGMSPRPPGISPMVDSTKVAIGRVVKPLAHAASAIRQRTATDH